MFYWDWDEAIFEWLMNEKWCPHFEVQQRLNLCFALLTQCEKYSFSSSCGFPSQYKVKLNFITTNLIRYQVITWTDDELLTKHGRKQRQDMKFFSWQEIVFVNAVCKVSNIVSRDDKSGRFGGVETLYIEVLNVVNRVEILFGYCYCHDYLCMFTHQTRAKLHCFFAVKSLRGGYPHVLP